MENTESTNQVIPAEIVRARIAEQLAWHRANEGCSPKEWRARRLQIQREAYRLYVQYGGVAAGERYLSHGFTDKMRAAIRQDVEVK